MKKLAIFAALAFFSQTACLEGAPQVTANLQNLSGKQVTLNAGKGVQLAYAGKQVQASGKQVQASGKQVTLNAGKQVQAYAKQVTMNLGKQVQASGKQVQASGKQVQASGKQVTLNAGKGLQLVYANNAQNQAAQILPIASGPCKAFMSTNSSARLASPLHAGKTRMAI